MSQDDFQQAHPGRVRFVSPTAQGRAPRSFYNDSEYLTDADFGRLYPGRVRFAPQGPRQGQLPQINEGDGEGDNEGDDEGDEYSPDDSYNPADDESDGEGDDEGDDDGDNEGNRDSTLPYEEENEDFGDLQSRLDSLNAEPLRQQTAYSLRGQPQPFPPPPPLPQAYPQRPHLTQAKRKNRPTKAYSPVL